MKRPPHRELKKPKTAESKGKRYRCCVCRRKAARKTKRVPYYCVEHDPLRGKDLDAGTAVADQLGDRNHD